MKLSEKKVQGDPQELEVQIRAITHAQFKAILKFILTRLHFQFFKNLFSDTHREKLCFT